jgi:probable phosphoglycerate mutase
MLVLIRHGNTFGPDDKVVWVGARTDLPLVEKGRAQGAAMGAVLLAAKVKVASIRCGPLLRTREAAAIIAESAGFPAEEITVDERLREIDYGRWEGLSADEVRARYGEAELMDWEERGVRPRDAGWSPPEETIAGNARAVLATPGYRRRTGEAHLVVSSNGILRYFGAALFGEAPQEFKMKTGNCALVPADQARAERRHWNLKPEEAAEPLRILREELS